MVILVFTRFIVNHVLRASIAAHYSEGFSLTTRSQNLKDLFYVMFCLFCAKLCLNPNALGLVLVIFKLLLVKVFLYHVEILML